MYSPIPMSECGDERQIRKRQIAMKMFEYFKNNSNFKWSYKHWDIKNPIPYIFEKEDDG